MWSLFLFSFFPSASLARSLLLRLATHLLTTQLCAVGVLCCASVLLALRSHVRSCYLVWRRAGVLTNFVIFFSSSSSCVPLLFSFLFFLLLLLLLLLLLHPPPSSSSSLYFFLSFLVFLLLRSSSSSFHFIFLASAPFSPAALSLLPSLVRSRVMLFSRSALAPLPLFPQPSFRSRDLCCALGVEACRCLNESRWGEEAVVLSRPPRERGIGWIGGGKRAQGDVPSGAWPSRD